MESATQHATTGPIETEPVLQVKRSLLPLEEYAAREGVSSSIIHKCGNLGIVQIRKRKGRSFVVDVPLSPHISHLENKARDRESPDENAAPMRLCDKIKEFTNPEEWTSRQVELDSIVSEKIGQRLALFKDTSQQCLKAKNQTNVMNKGLGPEVFESNRADEKHSSGFHNPDNFIKDYACELPELNEVSKQDLKEPAQKEMDDDEIIEMLGLESVNPVIKVDESNFDDDTIDLLDDELTTTSDSEPLPEPFADMPIDQIEELRILEETGIAKETKGPLDRWSMTKTKRFWQVTTLFVLLLFTASICVTVWLYSDYTVLQSRLEGTEANLLEFQNELIQSDSQIESLAAQLAQIQQTTELQQPIYQTTDAGGN
jgi:hypothetical protein